MSFRLKDTIRAIESNCYGPDTEPKDSVDQDTCPYWPGSPVKVHWGYPDPSNAPGGDEAKRQDFELTRQAIGYRMLQLLQLPLEQLSDADLQSALTEIYSH